MAAAPAAEAWQQEYERILPQLQQLQRQQAPPWPLRVLRSSQLDALRLDEELLAMLQEQFSAVFSLFTAGRIAAWEPELTAFMLFLVYRLSVGRGRASPGSELMNLRYRNERAMAAAAAGLAATGAAGAGQRSVAAAQLPSWLHGGPTGVEGPGLSPQQKGLYFLGTVLLPYLWVRASRAAVSADWGHPGPDPTASSSNWFQEEEDEAAGNSSSSSSSGLAERMWRALRWLEGSYRAASVVNMWLFLYDGRYRTLLERFMGARLVYKQPDMKRMISFEYLNRQLVWQELSEFLLFLLPLLNTDKLKQMVTQVFPRLSVAGGGVAVQQYFRAPEQQQQQDNKPDGGASSRAGVKQAPDTHHPGAAATSAGPVPGAGDQSSTAESLHGNASSSSGSHEERLPQQQQKPPDLRGPCPICGSADITVPFVALPCRHVFCYYCLRSHCQADARFSCPVDGVRVTAMQRYLPAWSGGAAAGGAQRRAYEVASCGSG